MNYRNLAAARAMKNLKLFSCMLDLVLTLSLPAGLNIFVESKMGYLKIHILKF